MRDITAEIARYLGERGLAAFADALPDEPDEAVGVYEYPATDAQRGVAGKADELLYPRAIQIRTRALGRERAFELAKTAFAWLSGSAEETPVMLMGGAALLAPRQTPALVERDNRARAVFSWNITVVV